MKHFLIALLGASIFITADTAQAKPRAGKKAKESINLDDPNMQHYKNQQSTAATLDIYNPSPEARTNPVETIDRAPAEENSLPLPEAEPEMQDP